MSINSYFIKRKYEALLQNNTELNKRIKNYDKLRKVLNFRFRVLDIKEKQCENLRNKILISLPEEKEELYKEIRKAETETKNLNKKIMEQCSEWRDMYDDIKKFAAETLKPNDYKFFYKHGGWQQDENG